MWQSYSVCAVIWLMLSTLPATGVRAGLLRYSACIICLYTCHSGLSSIMPISWPMMPCSFSTLSSVK